MKRLLTGALALLLPIAALATTLNPVQLLNPSGSTSGQTIVSTGASTVPAWANIPVANVTGAAALTGAAFTGDLTVSEPSAALIMNDTSGSGFPQFVYRSAGVNKWIVFDAPTTHLFSVNRYVGGVFQDAPLTIANSTGAVTMGDGITASPISGSTGSFTTLAASSTVSGAGFASLLSPYAPLASPTFTGTVTAAALTATGLITPSGSGIKGNTAGSNPPTGAIGELIPNAASGVSLTSATPANVVTDTLSAGTWDVQCTLTFSPAGTTTVTQLLAAVSTTSAALPSANAGQETLLQASFTTGATQAVVTPTWRVNASTSTAVFCIGQSVFGTSTMTGAGFIRAVRVW